MDENFLKDIHELDINKLISEDIILAGLDIGDKIVGISVTDRRIKIASAIGTLVKKFKKSDFEYIVDLLKPYNVGYIVFGWPLQMEASNRTIKTDEGQKKDCGIRRYVRAWRICPRIT